METFHPVYHSPTGRNVLGVVVAVPLLAVTVFITALFSFPAFVRYGLTDSELLVNMTKLGRERTRAFRLDDIEGAERVFLRSGRRVAGTALSNYCEGQYRYAGIGTVWQATSCGPDAVLLRVRGERLPVVLTPLDPDSFIRALESRQPARFETPVSRPSTELRALRIAMPLFLAALTVFIPAMVIVVPSRLNYVISEGRLVIGRLWRPRIASLCGASVRLLEPRATKRLAGSSMPGYYAGFFIVDGKKTRVYATTLATGVLVTEASGTRLFVTPAGPTEFLNAAIRNGAVLEAGSSLA